MLEEGGSAATLRFSEATRRAGVSTVAPYRHLTDKAVLLATAATLAERRGDLAKPKPPLSRSSPSGSPA